MRWGEMKTRLESMGISDETVVEYIDWSGGYFRIRRKDGEHSIVIWDGLTYDEWETVFPFGKEV